MMQYKDEIMFNIRKVFAVILCGCALAGCSAQASTAISAGALLLNEDFEAIDASSFPSYGLGEDLVFGVSNGSYAAIVTGGGYVWTLNDMTHSDVVIEVTTEKVSTSATDTYGIICRAHSSNNGMGYYFLINGSGYYGIRKGDGERIHVLVPWTQSRAIRTGQRENTLRVICVKDYLAFYINGQFVTETRDSQYVEGFAGFAVASEGERIAITYDNLTIHAASIQD
jgi:hypothetical protein